jgi:hypothetical protein
MPAAEPREQIERHLQEAIDRLRADLVRVEIWASALNGFSRPIPDYQPGDEATRHLLPRSDKKNATTRRDTAAPKTAPRVGDR